MTKRVVELQGGFEPAPVPPGWELQQQAGGLSTVYVLEPEKGTWSNGGKYGRLLNELVPPSIDRVLGVFSNDHIGKPRKRVLNLVRTDRRAQVDGNWDFYARIVHGVGGASNEFFCDWTGDVPIVADAIRVEAVFYAVNADLPYAPPDPNRTLAIGAFLGEVGGSPHFPPTFTTPYRFVADGDLIIANVPDFARGVVANVDRSPIAVDDFQLQFETSSGVFKQLDVTQEVMVSGAVLPGNTNSVFLFNNSGSPTNLSFTFVLGL
jgi:hypothetical protein